MAQSCIVMPEHLDIFEKGIAKRLDFAYAGPQSARIAQMLFAGKIELGAIHTYLELFARYFIDLTKLNLDLAPIMVYADDVTHIVTEEGMANLLLCRNKDEREQAIRGVAGYTDIGRKRDKAMVAKLRERGVVQRPHGSGRRSFGRQPQPFGGALGERFGALVRRALCAARKIPQLVRSMAMEVLTYKPKAAKRAAGSKAVALVGVVASGNAEILVERCLPDNQCEVLIKPPREGIGPVWEAVVADFAAEYSPGGLKFSINDGGARADTVALRLAQAARAIEGGQS